jgi:hypothetical protein
MATFQQYRASEQRPPGDRGLTSAATPAAHTPQGTIVRHLLELPVAIAIATAACAQQPASMLAGRWAPDSAVLGGQVFPVANFGGATLELTEDTYEFTGDRPTICCQLGAGERPGEFTSPMGSEVLMIRYKRVPGVRRSP